MTKIARSRAILSKVEPELVDVAISQTHIPGIGDQVVCGTEAICRNVNGNVGIPFAETLEEAPALVSKHHVWRLDPHFLLGLVESSDNVFSCLTSTGEREGAILAW